MFSKLFFSANAGCVATIHCFQKLATWFEKTGVTTTPCIIRSIFLTCNVLPLFLYLNVFSHLFFQNCCTKDYSLFCCHPVLIRKPAAVMICEEAGMSCYAISTRMFLTLTMKVEVFVASFKVFLGGFWLN